MNTIPNYIRTIVTDTTGEVTNSRWVGTWQVKAVMSLADQFAAERFYSRLLPASSTPTDIMKIKATALAELSVRIINGPSWWEATNKGQLMVDSDPIFDLFMKCKEAADEWTKELHKTAANITSNDNAIDPNL